MKVALFALLAVAIAAPALADDFPQCDALDGKLIEYRTDIADIKAALLSIKSVAEVIDPLGAVSCGAKADICKLSTTLGLIDTIGSKLGSIPNIGTVLKAMSVSAKAANIPAKQLCDKAKDLCNTLPAASSIARLYIQQYPNVNTALTAVDAVCIAGLATVDTATTAATPFCDGSDVDSSCGSVLNEIESAEAAAERLRDELEKLVNQQLENALEALLNAINSLANSIDAVMPSFDVLNDIFSQLDALNLPSLPGCTPAIPEVCIPGIPKQCVTIKYPCGIKTKCCGKIAGKCVCKKPVTKWCKSEQCTPASPPQCTPAVPEFCPVDVAIDELFSALGINNLPSLPGLGFLDVNLPELPDIGFYELAFSVDLPTLFEEFELDLPSIPGINFDIPDDLSLTFPTCLAV